MCLNSSELHTIISVFLPQIKMSVHMSCSLATCNISVTASSLILRCFHLPIVMHNSARKFLDSVFLFILLCIRALHPSVVPRVWRPENVRHCDHFHFRQCLFLNTGLFVPVKMPVSLSYLTSFLIVTHSKAWVILARFELKGHVLQAYVPANANIWQGTNLNMNANARFLLVETVFSVSR